MHEDPSLTYIYKSSSIKKLWHSRQINWFYFQIILPMRYRVVIKTLLNQLFHVLISVIISFHKIKCLEQNMEKLTWYLDHWQFFNQCIYLHNSFTVYVLRSNSVPVDLPIIIFTNFNHMNRSYGCTRTAQKNNLFVFPQWLLRFLKNIF